MIFRHSAHFGQNNNNKNNYTKLKKSYQSTFDKDLLFSMKHNFMIVICKQSNFSILKL